METFKLFLKAMMWEILGNLMLILSLTAFINGNDRASVAFFAFAIYWKAADIAKAVEKIAATEDYDEHRINITSIHNHTAVDKVAAEGKVA